MLSARLKKRRKRSTACTAKAFPSFLTATCAQQVPETLERYKTDPKCAVIPIPGSSGANGFGLSRVKANVEKAIGADILFNNEKEGT